MTAGAASSTWTPAIRHRCGRRRTARTSPRPRWSSRTSPFTEGDSSAKDFDGGGGGAVFDREADCVDLGNTDNRCKPEGPDLGGGAVRALSQIDDLPVYVVNSRFSHNACSNGGALGGLGPVSWTVLNSRFVDNQAIGHGANPAQAGTPGGGSGKAIYNDGDQMTLSIAGSLFTGNDANEGGGAVFFVSDDRTGTLAIEHSTLTHNPNAGFQTAGLPGIFFLGARSPAITSSVFG